MTVETGVAADSQRRAGQTEGGGMPTTAACNRVACQRRRRVSRLADAPVLLAAGFSPLTLSSPSPALAVAVQASRAERLDPIRRGCVRHRFAAMCPAHHSCSCPSPLTFYIPLVPPSHLCPPPPSHPAQSWIVKFRSRVIRVGEPESRLGAYTFRRRSSISASFKR